MVPIGIGDYGNVGMKLFEGAVAFVEFRNHVGTVTEFCVYADVAEFPPYGESRVKSRLFQDESDHGGCGRFPVSSGNTNAEPGVENPAQDLSPFRHGNSALLCRNYLFIFLGDGAAVHKKLRKEFIHVGLSMPENDGDFFFQYLVDIGGVAHVAAADLIAKFCEKKSKSAHPCATDAHKMNPAYTLQACDVIIQDS